jgi:hypothetical protein
VFGGGGGQDQQAEHRLSVECAAAVKIIEISEIRFFCNFCKNEFSIVFGIHMVWP